MAPNPKSSHENDSISATTRKKKRSVTKLNSRLSSHSLTNKTPGMAANQPGSSVAHNFVSNHTSADSANSGSGKGQQQRNSMNPQGTGGGGSPHYNPSISGYGSRHVSEMFMMLKDYMAKCDLNSYGPRSQPVANAWTSAITNDRKTFQTLANKVLSEIKAVFKSEERMVSIASPLYVFGDIHGNLHDLKYYERELWPNGPHRAKCSFLFLGDLVDRGHHSLEVIFYLFCCKLMSRKNAFVLIRGNHELRAIQQAFTFHRECIEKLGPSIGAQIWTAINKCFDHMPVAALIDNHIFCCHGGIPINANSIKDVYSVPCPLVDPENQSPLAWELMWNDPLTNSVFGEMAELLRLQSGSKAFTALRGFLPNNKRGTAYYFSEAAALRFMEQNNLSHVIRAHECLPTGYTLHANQKLITVFSSSKYCSGANDAACVLVDHDDVRVIRLDIGEHNAIPGPNAREQSPTA